MRIALMKTPWAADAAHIIEATTVASWRAKIAQLQPNKYAAAIWINGYARPVPVQIFNGARCNRDIMSPDNFLVVRTGLHGAKIAQIQWDALSNFPRQYADALRFIDTSMVGLIGAATHTNPSSSNAAECESRD